MNPIVLTSQQLEDLMEAGNIGAGNAATRLSTATRRKCGIDIPTVSHVTLDDIRQQFDEKNTFAVTICLRILGDLPAVVVVMTKRIAAHRIIRYMTEVDVSRTTWSLTSQMALKQIGEQVTRAFAESLHRFLNAKPTLTMPEIIIDSWSGGLNALAGQLGDDSQEKLMIHSTFFDDERTFSGKFLYVMNQDSVGEILRRLTALREG